MLPLVAQTQPPTSSGLVDQLARTPVSTILFLAAGLTLFRVIMWGVSRKVPPHRRYGLFKFGRFLSDTFDAIIYAAVVIFLIVRPFVIQTFSIPSESMVATLLQGDHIVVNKAIYRYSDPKFGDIVVFRPPSRALHPGQPEMDFIKRLIGEPGDVIEIRDSKLIRNGEEVAEPYVREPMSIDFKLVEKDGQVIPVAYRGSFANLPGSSTASEYQVNELEDMAALIEAPPAKIPEGYYLFMGDNRNYSSDGRFWGLVPRDSVIGRSEVIWLPLSRWRTTR